MKKILFILAACFCLTLAGCQFEKDIDLNNYDGKGLEFVHFNAPSESWLVTEDDETYIFDVPVGCSYAYDADKTYTINLGKGTTGVEGVDFKIPTKSVTIKAGEYVATVPVEVLYETTGLSFALELVLDVEDALVNPSYGKSDLITVKTDKVVIDWEWLEGDWIEQDESGDPYAVSFTKVDETHVAFNNLWGMEADMVGVVDFAARTITFPSPYSLGSVYGGSLMVTHIDADGNDSTEPIVAYMSALGISLSDIRFYLSGGSYDGYDFGTDNIIIYRD